MNIFLLTIALLGVLGLFGSLILYFTSKKFHVEEDPRIDEICEALPGANCGGCGFKGCRDFASQCVAQGNLDSLACPVGGAECMAKVAAILGVATTEQEKRVAVLKCAGSCSVRPQLRDYQGERSCAIIDITGAGATGCAFGCLGCGDCVEVCAFGALSINAETGLPEVDAQKCTACGKCTAECPRHLLELRPVGRRDRRVWVACSNQDKGAVARKACSAACIGCGKCAKECPLGAIEVNDNLAYIDSSLCKSCGKCLAVCPTGAIHATFTLPSKPAQA